MESKYLAFKLGDDLFMLTINNVHSIIQKENKEIRPIPNSPDYIAGITSLREKALLIINGQLLFNKPFEQKEEYVIIVLKDETSNIGLIVDQVIAVMQIDEDKIQTKNSFIYSSSITQGVYLDKENMYLVLDPEKVLQLKVE